MRYVIPLGLASLLFGVALADDVKVEAGREGVAVDVNRDKDDASGTLKKHGNAMRMSELIGLAVQNKAQEDLGKIEDVVVDLDTGKIRYAAVSMGGFLGIGDKLFAVPFHAITFRTHRDDGVLVDTTERIAVVNINKETFDNAQGFDNDNWPNLADRRWQELNDRPYRTGARTQPDDRTIDR
jgi:sporulation protein YlmC with PRC-barrel domain